MVNSDDGDGNGDGQGEGEGQGEDEDEDEDEVEVEAKGVSGGGGGGRRGKQPRQSRASAAEFKMASADSVAIEWLTFIQSRVFDASLTATFLISISGNAFLVMIWAMLGDGWRWVASAGFN